MVEFLFIDNHETVVGIFEGLNCDRRILLVVLLQIQAQLFGNGFSIDGCRDPYIPLAEERQHRIIDITINKNQITLCVTNGISDKRISAINLSIVEDSLSRRFIGFECLKDLLEVFL